MCGIFGYIGKGDPLLECIEGLKRLEYRGYDSAGIAGIKNGSVIFSKEVGRIACLEKKVNDQNLKMDIAIAHTRWATHGKPNEVNAHPHMDVNLSLALVHNGIIDNYNQIKAQLKAKGIDFVSETDTEVLAQLIAHNYKGNFFLAVAESLKLVKGSFAIAVLHKDHPNQIIAACRESPIAIGYDDQKTEILVSSDPNGFGLRELNVFYLNKDEIALISNRSIEVYDQNQNVVIKRTERLEGTDFAASKNGFEHFMIKEIFEQPVSVQRAMVGRVSDEFGNSFFEEMTFSSQELMATRHILIIACGTSWHAGSIAASMLEDKARIPTQAEIASEIRFKNPIISDETLVIAISQSGETADTIAAVREAKAKGAKILGICNVKNSTLVREAHCSIFLKAGPEISVCSTKAFTSQITVLYLFSLFMARLRHLSKEEGQKFLQELKKVPKIVKFVLNRAEEIERIAVKYSKYEKFFFLGRRYMYPTGLEAALKLKEISYLNANCYPAGELKHGPIALLSDDFPVIAFCSNKQTYEKMISNLMEVKARGAPILALASIGSNEVAKIADDVIWLPSTIDELAIFPSSIAGQLLAYYVARERKNPIDLPRNLAKSVTVE